MLEGTYIVRIWPSGTTTMGEVYYSRTLNNNYPKERQMMFRACESYDMEGGVIKGDVYGYIELDKPVVLTSNRTHYIHRLATDIEMKIFKKYNTLRDSIRYRRDILLEDLTADEI